MSSSSQNLKMVQCVPGWKLEEDPAAARLPFSPNSNISNHKACDDPELGYEVAELTYQNGQIAMHGLGLPRVMGTKPFSSTWEKPGGNGTLECIVNQAVHASPCEVPKQFHEVPKQIHNDLIPWFNHQSAVASATMPMDALVPSSQSTHFIEDNRSKQTTPTITPPPHIGTCISGKSTRVESCGGGTATATSLERSKDAGDTIRKRTRAQPLGVVSRNYSVSIGDTMGRESRHTRGDSCEMDALGSAFTSTSLGLDSNFNTLDTRDSQSESRPQKQSRTEDQSCQNEKSTLSTKRSRAAAIHNQSERKRRDKINQRMKTLQKLVPISSKTDKASMLDEVIEYLKTLQAQVQMMSKMSMPHMMMPMTIQQQLQMSMMAQMGMGMGMGMGMSVMDMSSMGRANIPGMPPMVNPAAFMPVGSWDSGNDRLPSGAVLPDPAAFLACQAQQPMTMDAYSRMAALYQQLHLQQQASNPKL